MILEFVQSVPCPDFGLSLPGLNISEAEQDIKYRNEQEGIYGMGVSKFRLTAG
jgi:hypothetical protein